MDVCLQIKQKKFEVLDRRMMFSGLMALVSVTSGMNGRQEQQSNAQVINSSLCSPVPVTGRMFLFNECCLTLCEARVLEENPILLCSNFITLQITDDTINKEVLQTQIFSNQELEYSERDILH